MYQFALRPGHDIRILNLCPAVEYGAPIEAKLFPVSFNDKIKYEALSYTWGPPFYDPSIELNAFSGNQYSAVDLVRFGYRT